MNSAFLQKLQFVLFTLVFSPAISGQIVSWQDVNMNMGFGEYHSLNTELSIRTPWNSEVLGNKGVLRFTYQKENSNHSLWEVAAGYFQESLEKDILSEDLARREFRLALGSRWSTDPELRFAYRLHIRAEMRVFDEVQINNWYGQVRLRARPEFAVAITKPTLTQNKALQGSLDAEFLQSGLGPWLDTEPRSSIRWRGGLTWRQDYHWRFGLSYFVETNLNDGFTAASHVFKLFVTYNLLSF